MNGTALARTISLDEVLENAMDGVFVIDRNRRYVIFNEGCERITGYRVDEVLGRECQCGDLIGCRDDYGRPLWGALCPTHDLFEGSTDVARQRMQLRRKDGSATWVETIYTPVRDRSGHVECILGVVRDVSEAKQREDELRNQLSTAVQQAREATAQAFANHSQTANDYTTAAGGSRTSTEAHPQKLDTVLERVEKELILKALREAGWHRNKAATRMGISRSRLYRRMEALGIHPGDLA